jgi:hypothetical protein
MVLSGMARFHRPALIQERFQAAQQMNLLLELIPVHFQAIIITFRIRHLLTYQQIGAFFWEAP